MRLAFFVVLLLNAIVAAWLLLQSDAGGAGPRPALRPEAIRIVPATAPVPPAPVAQTQCLEWSGLEAADLPQVRSALEDAGFGQALVQSGTSDYWVYIPPFRTRAEAEKKLAELKALGIGEGSVVEEGDQWRHAVSLAAFASAAEAESYLRQLRDKGVKSAKIMERQAPGSSLTLIRLDEAQRQKLDALQARLGKGSLKPVDCRLQ